MQTYYEENKARLKGGYREDTEDYLKSKNKKEKEILEYV